MTQLATLIVCWTMGSVVLAAEAQRDPPMVILERTACRGECPVYVVIVAPDGLVEFEGRGFVLKPGKHTSRLSAAQLAQLKNAVQPLGNLDLRDRPTPAEHLCEPAFDVPSSAITVAKAGAQERFTFEALCLKGATSVEINEIDKLARLIDEIAGTARWVGSSDQRKRHKWF